MLTYLILTTRATILAAIIGGVITGYTRRKADRTGAVIVASGAAVGLVASIVMAVFKNTTSLVDSGFWNSDADDYMLIFLNIIIDRHHNIICLS